MIASIFSGLICQGGINRARLRAGAAILIFTLLTSCATTSTHQFAEPTNAWELRTGQLLYRTAATTFIGDVVVRCSKEGDFDLTFSKGPGVNLLSIRQDTAFARVGGAFARSGWSGPVDHAPRQLRGWLQLRQRLSQSKGQRTVRVTTGPETFLFRF